ncbi:hypothetical protein BDQ17DRAFT_1551375 [Cyathus striatus]|nr:hypothetical protein BDQ17DRAFT_1551375 [Cyathus striatus]
MGAYYDEIEIEDMAWDEESALQLKNYEDIATCPSCSLIIRVIYDPLDYEDDSSEDEDDGEAEEAEDEDEEDRRMRMTSLRMLWRNFISLRKLR